MIAYTIPPESRPRTGLLVHSPTPNPNIKAVMDLKIVRMKYGIIYGMVDLLS
jgi:hypothetical protein